MRFRRVVAAIPLLFWAGAAWSAEPGLTISTYHGPIGRVDQSKSRGDEAYRAYRYGSKDDYAAYEAQISNSIDEYQRREREASDRLVDISRMRERTQRELHRPAPAPDLTLTLAERREIIPLPPGRSESDMGSFSDPLWTDVRANDVFALQEDLSVLQSQLSRSSEADRRFVISDLAYADIIDHQGVLDLPYAPSPRRQFQSSQFTDFGRSMRTEVNRALVSQSVIGAACANTTETAHACALWHGHLNEAIEGIYLLDRLVWIDAGRISKVNQVLYDTLKSRIDFAYGFARGFVAGGVSLADGLLEAITAPGQTLKALGTAIVNARQFAPMIKDGAVKLYRELQTAAPGRQGEIIGRAAFEITSLVVSIPVMPGVISAGELAGISTAAAYEALAQIVRATPKFKPLIKPFTVRSMFAAKAMGLVGEDADDFVRWSASYLDQTGSPNMLIQVAKWMTPDRYRILRKMQTELGTSVTQGAHEYLVRRAAYEEILPSVEKMREMVKEADRLDRALATVKGVPAPRGGIGITRSTKIYYRDKFSRQMANAIDSIFNFHDGGLFYSQRYTGVGSYAMYAVIGVDQVAERLSLEEIGAAAQSIPVLTARTTVQSSKILVLTDPVLNKLGLTARKLTLESEYDVTQMLGFLAERHGFDAIEAPSRLDVTRRNLILLKPLR